MIQPQYLVHEFMQNLKVIESKDYNATKSTRIIMIDGIMKTIKAKLVLID